MKNSGIYENFAHYFCNEHKTTDHHKNKLFSNLKINYYFFKRTHLKVNNTDIFYNVIMINYKKAAVLKCLQNLSERPSVDLFATFISLEF